jgi:hypothetical protein
MDDEQLIQEMLTEVPKEREVILVEYPISSTELHKIANGDCAQLNSKDCPFSIRFLLEHSQKSSKSNFVINRFKVQIVVSEQQKFMRKEEIATRTKVLKAKPKTKVREKVETKIESSDEVLF